MFVLCESDAWVAVGQFAGEPLVAWKVIGLHSGNIHNRDLGIRNFLIIIHINCKNYFLSIIFVILKNSFFKSNKFILQ